MMKRKQVQVQYMFEFKPRAQKQINGLNDYKHKSFSVVVDYAKDAGLLAMRDAEWHAWKEREKEENRKRRAQWEAKHGNA